MKFRSVTSCGESLALLTSHLGYGRSVLDAGVRAGLRGNRDAGARARFSRRNIRRG